MTHLKYIISIVACFILATVSAQSIDDFRIKLADPLYNIDTERTSSVETQQSKEATDVINAITSHANIKPRFQGYRLGIYSDNGPDAHESSLAAKTTFESNFPDINVYWVYDNPYFKVTAGDCLTEEEAVMLLSRVQTLFPKAYIVRANMTSENLILPKPKDEIITDEEASEGESEGKSEGEVKLQSDPATASEQNSESQHHRLMQHNRR